MAFYNDRSLTIDRTLKQSPRGPLAAFGLRLASTFRSTEDEGGGDDQDTLTDILPLRFAIVRRGYERESVDEYVAQLEAELAALDRELASPAGGSAAHQEVETEIRRIGEQTSAVLMAAHEQREEIVRQAQAEAERLVADASAKATAITTQCERRLRALGVQTEAAESQRDRLLDELGTISGALATVVESAQQRAAEQSQV